MREIGEGRTYEPGIGEEPVAVGVKVWGILKNGTEVEVVFERVEEGVREVDWENYRGGE